MEMPKTQAENPLPLVASNLGSFAPDVTVPTYDRTGLRPGIVHIGVGAFHRAHQAFYVDKLLSQGEAQDYAICGVGLLLEYLHAPTQREAVLDRMTAPECRIVTLTVTEGGYCFNQGTGEFDPLHPDIVHDLAHRDAPIGLYGFITEALRRRRDRGLAPFTVLSCDNIEHNGTVARTMLLAFA